MKTLCECNSRSCNCFVDLPLDVLKAVKRVSDRVIIVEGCPTGPEPTDELVSVEPGYSIYRDLGKEDR